MQSGDEDLACTMLPYYVRWGESVDPQTHSNVSKAADSILDGASDGKETPMHLSVRYGGLKTCRLLISHGADATLKNAKGLTPCHLAAKVMSPPPPHLLSTPFAPHGVGIYPRLLTTRSMQVCNPGALELLLPLERNAAEVERMLRDALHTQELAKLSLDAQNRKGVAPPLMTPKLKEWTQQK